MCEWEWESFALEWSSERTNWSWRNRTKEEKGNRRRERKGTDLSQEGLIGRWHTTLITSTSSKELEKEIVIPPTNFGNPQQKEKQKKKHSHKQMIKQHTQEHHQYHEQEQKDEWEQHVTDLR